LHPKEIDVGPKIVQEVEIAFETLALRFTFLATVLVMKLAHELGCISQNIGETVQHVIETGKRSSIDSLLGHSFLLVWTKIVFHNEKSINNFLGDPLWMIGYTLLDVLECVDST
jgi:hypothetical protein